MHKVRQTNISISVNHQQLACNVAIVARGNATNQNYAMITIFFRLKVDRYTNIADASRIKSKEISESQRIPPTKSLSFLNERIRRYDIKVNVTDFLRRALYNSVCNIVPS